VEIGLYLVSDTILLEQVRCTDLSLTTTWMLISPLFPLPCPPLVEATVFLPFFGLLCRLATSCPFVADAEAEAEAELADLADPLGIRFGGGIASDAEDAVLDTVGCLMPVVVVGLRDIVGMV
jgi:hypothetical protein